MAEANPAKGVYYTAGTSTNGDEATRMTPDETGHLYLYGVEEGACQLTETQTDAGYTLLEDVITVDIDTKYTPGVQVGSLTAPPLWTAIPPPWRPWGTAAMPWFP